MGHNSRRCPEAPTVVKPQKGSKRCGICGDLGHNARTCFLKLPEKKKKQCGICGDLGHNARTCEIKCRPCADQVLRSYCFAGMSAQKAVEIARILECNSIYGETEEYPQFVQSP
jgi:hypothetical protein